MASRRTRTGAFRTGGAIAAGAAILAAAMLFAGAGTALAQDVVIFNKKPPTADELANILFPQKAAKRKYRGLRVKRPSAAEQTEQFGREVGLVINFEFNSAKILPDSRPYLDEMGKMMALKQVAGGRLVIEGHTDAAGAETYNQRLSERRAIAVKRYLVQTYGVEPARLTAVGRGERAPLDANDPLSPVNRRVQFRAITIK